MNTSITYPFVPSLGYNPINTLASMPGMPCHCRTGIRVTQALINAKLTSTSRRLDDLDAALASSSLPGWTGTAAEAYLVRGSMSYASNPWRCETRSMTPHASYGR